MPLPTRFRRTGPAAAPYTSDTVITCEKPPAPWMGIDRQGTFPALAPTTHISMSVGDCQQRGMQPGHPESRAGAQTAVSVDPMRWAPSVLRNSPPSQGQRPWPTINTPPWHSSRHTSPRITICSPTPQHSNPRSIQANPPSRLPAHPPESLHLDDNTFVDHCQCFTTCKSHCITTHHNTPCFVNAARTCFAYVCLPALLCPCAFFGCDLLACMGQIIFSFLCKHTSAALRHVCLCTRM